ncbi:hypothetical protein R6Q59_030007 [Mikania micrantha]
MSSKDDTMTSINNIMIIKKNTQLPVKRHNYESLCLLYSHCVFCRGELTGLPDPFLKVPGPDRTRLFANMKTEDRPREEITGSVTILSGRCSGIKNPKTDEVLNKSHLLPAAAQKLHCDNSISDRPVPGSVNLLLLFLGLLIRLKAGQQCDVYK